MDDTACREFFQEPTETYHRRYEALRAVFIDKQSQKEVAREFGFSYGSMRQLVREFRRYCDAGVKPAQSPFFATSMLDGPLPVTTRPAGRPLPIDENSSSRQANRSA